MSKTDYSLLSAEALQQKAGTHDTWVEWQTLRIIRGASEWSAYSLGAKYADPETGNLVKVELIAPCRYDRETGEFSAAHYTLTFSESGDPLSCSCDDGESHLFPLLHALRDKGIRVKDLPPLHCKHVHLLPYLLKRDAERAAEIAELEALREQNALLQSERDAARAECQSLRERGEKNWRNLWETAQAAGIAESLTKQYAARKAARRSEAQGAQQ